MCSLCSDPSGVRKLLERFQLGGHVRSELCLSGNLSIKQFCFCEVIGVAFMLETPLLIVGTGEFLELGEEIVNIRGLPWCGWDADRACSRGLGGQHGEANN